VKGAYSNYVTVLDVKVLGNWQQQNIHLKKDLIFYVLHFKGLMEPAFF
jgi:hypothetical protein